LKILNGFPKYFYLKKFQTLRSTHNLRDLSLTSMFVEIFISFVPPGAPPLLSRYLEYNALIPWSVLGRFLIVSSLRHFLILILALWQY
ncbi:hypothetical protein L9F63_027856, partial [Diploptera punctata]